VFPKAARAKPQNSKGKIPTDLALFGTYAHQPASNFDEYISFHAQESDTENPEAMTEKYPTGTRTESERLVREWGFRHIFTWTDQRYVQAHEYLRDDTPKMGEPIELFVNRSFICWWIYADLAVQQRPLFPALAQWFDNTSYPPWISHNHLP
jgi:hypothetical protein